MEMEKNWISRRLCYNDLTFTLLLGIYTKENWNEEKLDIINNSIVYDSYAMLFESSSKATLLLQKDLN